MALYHATETRALSSRGARKALRHKGLRVNATEKRKKTFFVTSHKIVERMRPFGPSAPGLWPGDSLQPGERGTWGSVSIFGAVVTVPPLRNMGDVRQFAAC